MDEPPPFRPKPTPRPRPLPPVGPDAAAARPAPPSTSPSLPIRPALPPDPLTPAQARFVPDRRYTALAAGGVVGAALAALVTDDAGGRLLFVAAAAVLLGYVVCDLVFSPRVLASAEGIVVRAPMTRARLAWSEVHEVRAETRFRRGLRSTALEIDAGSVLAVFSPRALGADPVEAAELIEAFRPR